MKQLIIAGVVATVLLGPVGCGKSSAAPGTAKYLTVSASKIAFIQWRVKSDGHLQGMITEDSVGGSGSTQTLSTSSAPFIGVMTGKSVRLTFAVLYFLRAHAQGVVSGRALRMTIPQSDGTVRPATFSQSDDAGYRRALAALRSRIKRAVFLAARQQGGQRGRSAHALAEQSAQSALSRLYADSSLAFGGKLAGGLTSFAGDIRAARFHLARENADALGADKYCGAAATVTGDAQAVDGALQNAQGAVSALMPDVAVVRHDVAIATAYLRHLTTARLPVPSLAPNVVANASASLKQAIATANSDISQINAIDARAHSLADNLATGRCSGARSGRSTHPIPPVGP